MPYKNHFIATATDGRPWVVGFGGDTGFLCNFSPEPVLYEGIQYPTSEHAFAAAKTLDPEKRAWVARQRSPGDAKHAGRQLNLRPDWDKVRVREMYLILKAKFEQNHQIRAQLLSLDGHWLMEGNGWGDQVWGCTETAGHWIGQNNLGKVLMTIRDEILYPEVIQSLTIGNDHPGKNRLWKNWGTPPWVETKQPTAGDDCFWGGLTA